jgi:hypothetical protein
MTDREYWFARRFPLGDGRQSVAPVHWKGYAASGAYVVALLVGGGFFLYFGLRDQLLEGAAIFGVVAFVAGAWFVLTARANGDPVRTIADYKQDKKSV